MADDPAELIDAIYEASFSLGQWPALLTRIARAAGSKGGLVFASTMDGVRWCASPGTDVLYEEFLRQGWAARNERVPRLLARRHAGFLTDDDLLSPAEIATWPLYVEFLAPLGYQTNAATAIPGLAADELVLSVEGFADSASAHAAVPMLDTLRPHLARASMLAARFRLDKARAAAEALGLLGVAAAVLGTGRRILAMNGLFEARLAGLGADTPRGLVLRDGRADAGLGMAVAGLRSAAKGRSIPLRLRDPDRRAVLHLVPMRGFARDLFSGASAIVALAEASSRAVPEEHVIRSLLDLTPAEARLARRLAGGATLQQAAEAANISLATVRSQLRDIFSKTGFTRQADLVALLASVASPVP